jgi:hypothetical protein
VLRVGAPLPGTSFAERRYVRVNDPFSLTACTL